MQAEPKSRQERAIAALFSLCETVEKRGGHRLGLVVFATRVEVLCPLTRDYDHFRFVLQQLADGNLVPDIYPKSKADISGTRIGAALIAAAQLHDPRAQGAQDILLISDGDDPARDQEWQQGIAAARKLSMPVDVVGVGDPDVGWPCTTRRNW
jgi:Ca-activated chloride channel family protein